MSLIPAVACIIGCSKSAPKPSSSPASRPAATEAAPRKPAQRASEAISENEKIERLIGAVRDLDGAVFIRHDVEYTAEKAAQHMRDKWQNKVKEIHTAEDFIRIAASKSWVSGRPYLIRFSDGRQTGAAEFLRGKLAEINAPTRPDGG